MATPRIEDNDVSPPGTPTRIIFELPPLPLPGPNLYSTSTKQETSLKSGYHFLLQPVPSPNIPSLCGSKIASANTTPSSGGGADPYDYDIPFPLVCDVPSPSSSNSNQTKKVLDEMFGQLQTGATVLTQKPESSNRKDGYKGRASQRVEPDAQPQDTNITNSGSLLHWLDKLYPCVTSSTGKSPDQPSRPLSTDSSLDFTRHADTQSEASCSEWWGLESSPDAESAPLSPDTNAFHDKIVVELLQSFREWQDSTIHTSQSNSNEPTLAASSSTASNPTSTTPLITPSKEKQLFSGGNKRPSDDDELPPLKRVKFDPPDEEGCNRALACPFAKNDPVRYRKCFGYAKLWTISRLK
jgi:hypothetical protein